MPNESYKEKPEYDRSYYELRYPPTPKRAVVWASICKYLQRYMPRDGAVLDIGAGYCSFINNVPASEKFALDVFPEYTKYANKDVTAYVGSCCDMKMFSTDKFDVIFASNLIEHLTREQTRDMFIEVRRILKPRGLFIAVQPNFYYSYRSYYDDYMHLQAFTHASLADLLGYNGFDIENIQPRFLPFSFKNRLPIMKCLVDIYLHLPFRPFAKQMLVIGRLLKDPES